ncbi:MoaD/ThiS family protein [Arthrobacter sp. Sa2CUA1]|uniref:MoaD/ThiS family protein n=1 Tax=Arthrobacter gallicola TaxID=2762225 RepID=A0ABR8UQG6_9MICC|nr:MoaD/ThiS family protein [Arthrobacter gallicola]MBD7994805.1 MoaD/ThiS family protein [Arthrobacter gallicola]
MTAGEVRVLLPEILAATADGQRELTLPGSEGLTVRSLLTAIGARYPVLERRIRDETGTVRRYVNIYIDGQDIRGLNRQDSVVGAGAEVMVLQSIAGG